MYKTRISKNDPDMLKQQIIHYKAEISRYQKQLKEYQENYYYRLIDELRKENERLNELVNQLQSSNEGEEEEGEKEQIEDKLHFIRDKSIEQLSEMKEENDRLKANLEELQIKIKELENNQSRQLLNPQLVDKQEGTEQSDWFMRTLRERNAINGVDEEE